MVTHDFHLDSRFSNLEYKARLALEELEEFWTKLYGPNEALTPATDALEAMRDTWEGREGVGWWVSSSGRIEIPLTLEQAESCSGPGAVDAEVRALSEVPAVTAVLERIDAATLRAELSEYGAWDADDLADHGQNLQRVLWIAACDLAEEAYAAGEGAPAAG